MTQRILVLSFSLLTLLPGTAAANCEADLSSAFTSTPNEKGLLPDSLRINVDTLSAAYYRGAWPWAITDQGMGVWYRVPIRGIMRIDNKRIPEDLPSGSKRAIKRLKATGLYRVTFDQNFRGVIEACAAQERKDGMWITATHIEQFTKMHEAGRAHSIEVWKGEELVGGVYGVFVGGVFSGESMFHRESDVTKLAYAALIERLQSNGHTFFDTQQANGLSKDWGAELIPREQFESMLEEAHRADRPF